MLESHGQVWFTWFYVVVVYHLHCVKKRNVIKDFVYPLFITLCIYEKLSSISAKYPLRVHNVVEAFEFLLTVANVLAMNS